MSATKLWSDNTPFNFPHLSPTASLGIAEEMTYIFPGMTEQNGSAMKFCRFCCNADNCILLNHEKNRKDPESRLVSLTVSYALTCPSIRGEQHNRDGEMGENRRDEV